MLEAFLMNLSSQLPFLDTIWQSEWYLANGSGHNQIKIHLILNEVFNCIQQILSCGIFNFCIPRMLEAFDGFIAFCGRKRKSSDRVFCTTNGSGHKHYNINLMVQDC